MMRGQYLQSTGSFQVQLPLSIPLIPQTLFFQPHITVRGPGPTLLWDILIRCLTVLRCWSLTGFLHFSLDLGSLTSHFELSF